VLKTALRQRQSDTSQAAALVVLHRLACGCLGLPRGETNQDKCAELPEHRGSKRAGRCYIVDGGAPSHRSRDPQHACVEAGHPDAANGDRVQLRPPEKPKLRAEPRRHRRRGLVLHTAVVTAVRGGATAVHHAHCCRCRHALLSAVLRAHPRDICRCFTRAEVACSVDLCCR